MRTRIAAAALGAAALITLSACSSSGSSDDQTDRPSANTATDKATSGNQQDEAASGLKQAVADYTALLFKGDPAGYDYLSARCKTQLSHEAWNALAKQGHHDYGSQKATGITVDEISGNLARVSYGAGHIPAMERKAQPWAREGGTWRWDACQTTN